MIFFTTFFLSLFITISLIPPLRRLALRVHALDFPEERKVHATPIPKCGGIAMAVGALIPLVFWASGDRFVRGLVIGASIVVLFGLLDDFKNLSYKAKFLGQVVAALVVIFYGGVKITSLGALLPAYWVLPDAIAAPLTLIVIVGITNAINLSDGLDGLAGGITFLSFACIGYLAYRVESYLLVAASVAAIGAIFGFLRYNTFPASLFMGDAGSQFLGFVAVTLCLKLTQSQHVFSALLPLIILGFPVLDTLTVMFERKHHGRPLFAADKNHFHHRLMRLGLVHKEAVLLIYFLQSLLVVAAFLFRFNSEWFLLVVYAAFCAAILGGFFVAGKARWRMRRYHFLDVILHGKLQAIQEKNMIIKVSFRGLETTLPVLLLVTCFLPSSIPLYVSLLSLALLVLLVGSLLWKKAQLDNALRLALFLITPFLIYLSAVDAFFPSRLIANIYNVVFGLMAISVVLTLKFTRRQKGFKTTPLDFLILFVAIVVPNLFIEQAKVMGEVAVKMIILFFGYEVLINELRGEIRKFSLATLVTLATLGIRAIV